MTGPTLFDAAAEAAGPGRAHRDGTRTEKDTAAAVAPRTGSQRVAVLLALHRAGTDGLTDFEASVACGIRRPHVAGTRRADLERDGFVVATSRTRATDCNRQAIVWQITAEGIAEAQRLAEGL